MRADDNIPENIPQTSRCFRWLRLLLPLALFTLPAIGGILTMIDLHRDGVGLSDGLAGANGAAVSPDGLHLYVSSGDDNALTAYRINPSFGTLSWLEMFQHDDANGTFGMLGASAVATSPDGRHVYVSAAAGDTLAVYHRTATLDDLVFIAAAVQENGVGGIFGIDGAAAVAVSPDDEFVFVAGSVSDSLAVFSRDATTDDLYFVTAKLDSDIGIDGIDGASGVAVAESDTAGTHHVYVTGELDDAVAVFEVTPSGTTTFVDAYVDGVGGVDGLNGASAVAVSPDGRHVYATGYVDDAVAAFSRDSATGELTFLQVLFDGVNGTDGLRGPVGLAVSPLGTRVLGAAMDDNAVSVLRRDPSTGELAFLEAHFDGVGGVDGLGGVMGVAFSPDGAKAFSAAGHENAVGAFDVAICNGDTALGDADGDAICNDLDLCEGDDLSGDSDADGFCNNRDICPGFDDTVDSDGDTIPDGCDLCFGNNATGDSDGDGFCNNVDICPGFDDAIDSDGDAIPNGCDVCFGNNASGDSDADGVCDNLDACLGNDASGDNDSDNVCNDTDCAINNPAVSVVDGCGVCGGSNSTCGLFFDGFESGNTSAWSVTTTP